MAVKARTASPLTLGKEVEIFNQSVTGSGTLEEKLAVDAESVLVSLYVTSTSGDVDVEVFTEGADGQEVSIISFPTIAAPTSQLLLRKAASTMQRIKFRVAYTGDCTFTIRARGVSAGASSVTIEGSSNVTVTRTSVTTTAAVLLAAALEDRRGILIENISDLAGPSSTIYFAETLAKATTGLGHPIRPGGNVAIDLQAGAELYAVAASGTVAVSVIEAGGD